MNPDNPYAAPQTIGQPPLAVAVSAETQRLAFPEYSTERLKQLLDYARAIQQMHIVWILLAVLAVAWFLIISAIAVHEKVGIPIAAVTVGVMILIFLRVAAGYSHRKLARGYSMLCDGLLFVGGMWLIVFLLQDGSLILPLILGFIVIHAASSFLAHCHARELFGQRCFKQEDLALEVLYRQQNGIV